MQLNGMGPGNPADSQYFQYASSQIKNDETVAIAALFSEIPGARKLIPDLSAKLNNAITAEERKDIARLYLCVFKNKFPEFKLPAYL